MGYSFLKLDNSLYYSKNYFEFSLTFSFIIILFTENFQKTIFELESTNILQTIIAKPRIDQSVFVY
jgi:hypothetical protein